MTKKEKGRIPARLVLARNKGGALRIGVTYNTQVFLISLLHKIQSILIFKNKQTCNCILIHTNTKHSGIFFNACMYILPYLHNDYNYENHTQTHSY